MRSAARFLRDLSVSRSSSRRNHAAGTRSSSKSCDKEDGKLHGRFVVGYVLVVVLLIDIDLRELEFYVSFYVVSF